MKTCSYCGQEYPDDISVCPIDGQAMKTEPESLEARKTVIGVWRGVYLYTEPTALAAIKPVSFTLRLTKQSLLGHFTGTVTEDAPEGTSGTGVINGYYGAPTIEFTQQMPVAYTVKPDSSHIPDRVLIIAAGNNYPQDLPGPVISYEGEFLDARRMQGAWTIHPQKFPLPGGRAFLTSLVSGYWCAEFITDDLKADPVGGPTGLFIVEPTPPETELETDPSGAPEDGAFRSMGKFAVMDAKELLKKFEQEHLRFEIDRDDTAMREMMPFTQVTGGYSGTAPLIEIFIHRDDEMRAIELMDNKV
jgi:hypothetical protein